MKKSILTLERSKYENSDGEYTYKVIKATNTVDWIVWSELAQRKVDAIIGDRLDVTVHIVPPKV